MLRWADKRPWRAETHIRWAGDLPEIDLHDLDARHARKAVQLAAGQHLDTGAMRFVTGRGRHTLGPGGVLGGVVRGELVKLADGRDWIVRPSGPARWLLITDPERAPASATGALGAGFWLFMAGFALAACVTVARAFGLL